MKQELENLLEGGETDSLWHASTSIAPFSPLTKDLSVDVVIVGAGLAGLTSAYLLIKSGKSVAVLEDSMIGSGETGRTTAHLTNEIDNRYYRVAFLHGEEGARLAAESQTQAIDMIERIVNELHIDCDFERLDGYLFVNKQQDGKELKKELKAVHNAGIADAVLLDSVPSDTFISGPCLRFSHQAQFHPLKYLAALTDAVIDRGGAIYTNTHVESFESEGGSEGKKPVKITTSDKRNVQATTLIVATNSPVNDRYHMHTKQTAYRTYAIGCEIARGSFPKMLLWDTEDPYHYVRVQEAGERDILIVGGEDHRVGQKDSDHRDASNARFSALEAWTREHVTIPFHVKYQWSGQVLEPVDALGYAGRQMRTNTYIITGDSGMGMTNCTAGAMIVTDLILGRDNPWSKLYVPSRKTLRATPEYLKENLNTASEYTEYLTPGEISDVSKIPAASGAILRKGLKKLALYRDESGTLHQMSAVCPHLGCIVDWNPVEASWDCPCHGSRFTPLGEVMNGPALAGLTKVEGE